MHPFEGDDYIVILCKVPEESFGSTTFKIVSEIQPFIFKEQEKTIEVKIR